MVLTHHPTPHPVPFTTHPPIPYPTLLAYTYPPLPLPPPTTLDYLQISIDFPIMSFFSFGMLTEEVEEDFIGRIAIILRRASCSFS